MCTWCAFFCQIEEGDFGKCWVKKNINWKLYLTVYWKALWVNIDPVEKKPLYHFFPWSWIFSWWTAWCNFSCLFCQNYSISQLKNIEDNNLLWEKLSPEDIIKICKQYNINMIAATYNEPTIFATYAIDVFKLAKLEWIKTVFVSNGFQSKYVLKKLSQYLDAINIDLKSYTNNFYKKLTWWDVEVVKKNIEYILQETDIWLEITTLLIPWYNDSEEELKNIANYIYKLDKNIPWHISAFFPTYKMQNIQPTDPNKLIKAYNIWKNAGLNYIYLWNVNLSWKYSNTYCSKCNKLLIERSWYNIKTYFSKNWICPNCWKKLEWVFD